MSNQILVYGYIEVPEGSEGENAKVLLQVSQVDASRRGTLVETFSPLRTGSRAVMCSFAGSYKRTNAHECQRLQNEFEQILKQLRATSAHLSIEDHDSAEERFIDYAHGPAYFGGPDVWRRVCSSRIRGEPEELDS